MGQKSDSANPSAATTHRHYYPKTAKTASDRPLPAVSAAAKH